MRLQGFAPTTTGSVLVLTTGGGEEGWYPITIETAERLRRQLDQAINDARGRKPAEYLWEKKA